MYVRNVFTLFALVTGIVLWPVTAPAQTFTLLHAFAPVVSGTNADGTLPYGGLALSGNVLYGTTFNAGANSNGTVFAVKFAGSGFTNLHGLSVRGGPFRSNAVGACPAGSL